MTFTLQYQHQYQVREPIKDSNDQTLLNKYTGQHALYAPDNDPSINVKQLHPIDDPLSFPSNNNLKPIDVLYHQSLDYAVAAAAAAPLIQNQQFSPEQQYSMQPNYNPTYLVKQSNNLLSQHQQYLTPQLLNAQHGYVSQVSPQQPQQQFQVFNSFDFAKPQQQAASLGQIYSAEQDQLNQLQEANAAYAQILEPKPSNYQYSANNFIDLPDERLTQKDIHNLINYQDYINNRQLENDFIIKEAHNKLENYKAQQQAEASDLHNLVTAEKLRIIVADGEGLQKRVDHEDYYDEEEENQNSEKSN